MSNAARFLIITALLLLAGLLDAGAYASKTRVGNFLSPAPVATASAPSQVLDAPLENWSLYDGTASGRPFGFINGPNLYTYVRQNPWTSFDPEGLSDRKTSQDVEPAEKVHHKVPVSSWDKNGMPKAVQDAWNGGDSVIGTQSGQESHNYTGHGEYNRRVDGELKKYIIENGNPSGLSASAQKEWADNFVKQLDNTQDKYIKGFNGVVGEGRSATKNWVAKDGVAIVKAETTALQKLGKVGGEILEHGGRLLKVAGVVMTVSEFVGNAKAEGVGPAAVEAVEQTVNPIGLSQKEMNNLQRQAYEGFWDKLTEGVYDNDQKDRWNTYPDQK